MSTLDEHTVVRSPWPDPEVPGSDLTTFVLRHAGRLAGEPAVIDGASGRVLFHVQPPSIALDWRPSGRRRSLSARLKTGANVAVL